MLEIHYLEHFREESGADFFTVKVIQPVEVGDGVTQSLARRDGSSSTWAVDDAVRWLITRR